MIGIEQSLGLFTSKVVGVMDERLAPKTGLLSLAKPVYHTSKDVMILARRGTRKVAQDILAGSEGNYNKRSITTEKIFTPPEYSEKFNVSAYSKWDKNIITNGFTTVDQMTDLASLVAADMMSVKDTIDRAINLQIMDILNTGIVNTIHGGSIDYKRNSTMLPVLTGADLWSATTADIEKNFQNWGSLLIKVGGTGNGKVKVIFGTEALAAFKKSEFYKNNVLQVSNNGVQGPGMVNNMPDGFDYLFDFTCGNKMFSAYAYEDYYENASGVEVEYVDSKKVYLLPESLELIVSYGDVPTVPQWQNPLLMSTNLGQATQGYNIYNEAMTRKGFDIGIEARPLAQLVTVDKLLTATVL